MMRYSEFIDNYAKHPVYKAPTGSALNARSWQTEAPLRMLLNNLDAAVAEDPEQLIVYGGTGQAARNPEAVKEIIRILCNLDEDHSLLIQSGKPVGLVRTHSALDVCDDRGRIGAGLLAQHPEHHLRQRLRLRPRYQHRRVAL